MDPKKNPANILDRVSLKPGGVETCRCGERDAAHTQNAEGCVLGRYLFFEERDMKFQS